MNNIKIDQLTTLDDATLASLVAMEEQIFDTPLTADAIAKTLSDKKDLLISLASDIQNCCAYKIGYQHSSEVYYSWIGGVLPTARRQGLAAALMQEQHRRAKELGYKYVRTYTRNKYRAMLLLNIKSGFDIIGIEKNLGDTAERIILEKEL